MGSEGSLETPRSRGLKAARYTFFADSKGLRYNCLDDRRRFYDVTTAHCLRTGHDCALLDEPTNSLDFRAMQDLRDLCRRLAQSGTGILLVTHHLPDVIPEITRVILLKQGRVFRDGPKDEVLTSHVLRELFGSAVELVRRDGYYHLL